MTTATKCETNGVIKSETVPAERAVEFTPFMSKDPIKLSVAIVRNMICVPTRSGKTCTDAQAMKFMMLCRARELNPFEGDAYLIGYDTKDGPQFSLITAHQAFLKRAETHPEYDGMESGVIVKTKDGELVDREGDFILDDDKCVGGWATVHFKARKFPMKKRVKLTTFSKNFGRWLDDPAGMIVKCAEADALRSSFPTMLGGMYLDDELPAATATAKPAAAALNSQFGFAPAEAATDVDPETVFEHPEPDGIPTSTVGDLATLAESLGCSEDECLNVAEAALRGEYAADPEAWIRTKPWPKANKTQKQLG